MRLDQLLQEMKDELNYIKTKHDKKVRAQRHIEDASKCIEDMEENIEKLKRAIVGIWNWTSD